ncbi:MAG: DUF2218 domain-containing protein [Janthinobacterium lividum]
METIATVATPNGSKYLQQLCKHWSHKFEVEFDAHAGKIAFPTGALHLAASPEALTLTIAGPDAPTLDRMEVVVIDHLQRFAFREELKADWARA